MQTPLFKRLKENGTSFYAFPGAAEDISAAYQNSNYKMYFSKYILLNFPKQDLVDPGLTSSEYIYWNFSTFSSISTTQPQTFGEQAIESLRNYVANQEITIRESRLNNTEYYYDTNALETTSEKIFFKWCKNLGLISFEPALPKDEYFDNLEEFERNNLSDDSYFREYLWKERETNEYGITSIDSFNNFLKLTMGSITNFRKNDIIEIFDINSVPLSNIVFGVSDWLGPIRVKILDVTTNINDTHDIILDLNAPITLENQTLAYAKLVYHRLVKYVGEVNGVSNVQEANKAYTEVYAHIPDHAGQTPDILFRTEVDVNYKPGMIFPIIPNQYQPEIIGAELFSSPIVSSPQNYPGSYYGQFDTEDFTYELSNGDSLRRSGDYFGVNGDINAPVISPDKIDGIVIDFDISHYVKMNLPDRSLSNFDQFNALEVNNEPPKDFEFNAILWYYTVEDNKGNKKTNVYGISFLDHPDNNLIPDEVSLRFPPYKKLVSNGEQDGTSYAFSLNLNFNIIHDNPIEAYNPEAINSLFSMSLFNEAMKRLASANDSFLNVISEHSALKDEILKVKQLIYSQTEFSTINNRISNLQELLNLYSTMQSISSPTIEVELLLESSPPLIRYNSIDTKYISITDYNTTDMYNTTGIIPVSVIVPDYKDFLVQIINNDEVELFLPDENNLKLILSSDLIYKQSVDILINASELSTQNKKLDIYISTINPLGIGTPESEILDDIITIPQTASDESLIETLIISDIDLPVFYNSVTSQPNSAKTWKNFNFNIDFNKEIILTSNNLLQLSIDSNPLIVNNSIKQGDALTLNNLFIGTNSVFDFSGQYIVDDVGATNSMISLDVSNNQDFLSYASGQLPLTIHGTSSTLLSNNPYLGLNKGQLIRITRISELNQIPVSEKYLIDIRDLNY
jgi:hypothetical protein